MGFSRQEYWSELPYTHSNTGVSDPPGDLPDLGIQSTSLIALTGEFFTTSAPWEVI